MDLKQRVEKLLQELDTWFIVDNITPPNFVTRQIENVKKELVNNG